MESMILSKSEIKNKCRLIGSGCESKVYDYKDKYAIKLFQKFFDEEMLDDKYEKIKAMVGLHHDSFCFPLGTVVSASRSFIGYYMPIVKPCYELKSVRTLASDDYGNNIKLDILKKASLALEWAHEHSIVIGDISVDNILINEKENPVFIDTDNYDYDVYGYNVIPLKTHYFRSAHGKECSGIDNDKYVFSLLALYVFFPEYLISCNTSEEFFSKLIDSINVPDEMKDGLRYLVGPNEDKPYFHEIVPDKPLARRLLKDKDKYELKILN